MLSDYWNVWLVNNWIKVFCWFLVSNVVSIWFVGGFYCGLVIWCIIIWLIICWMFLLCSSFISICSIVVVLVVICWVCVVFDNYLLSWFGICVLCSLVFMIGGDRKFFCMKVFRFLFSWFFLCLMIVVCGIGMFSGCLNSVVIVN